MSDVLLTPHYALLNTSTPQIQLHRLRWWQPPSCLSYSSCPHASSYLLSCSARCNAERSPRALHQLQPRGLKSLKSLKVPGHTNVLLEIVWGKMEMVWLLKEAQLASRKEECWGLSQSQFTAAKNHLNQPVLSQTW